jgi:hypothetical protein
MTELATVAQAAPPSTFDLIPSRADTDSWTTVVAAVAELAQRIAGTEFVPKGLRNSVPATAAAMLYGREVGLPPMTSLASIHVVEGRPGMSAEAMRALVLAAGHEIAFDETTGAVCRIRGRRNRSQHWTVVEWSLDMARAAGLSGRDNWRKYPRAMLIARASTDLCRMVFPDVVHGFRSVEELDDMDTPTTTGAAQAAPSSSTTVQRRPRKRAASRTNTDTPVDDEAQTPPRNAAGVGTGGGAPNVRPPGPGASHPAGGPPLPGEPGYDDAPAHTGTPPGEDPGPTNPPVPPPVSSAADTSTAPNVSAADPPAQENAPAVGRRDEEPGPRLVNRATLRMMFREFGRLGVTDDDRDKRLRILATMVGHPIATANDLTQEEATRATAMISAASDLDALRKLVDLTVDEPLPEAENPIREDPVEETLDVEIPGEVEQS